MSEKLALLALAAASAAVLAVALISQYGFGLHPCELCLYQRYPYMAVIVLAAPGAVLTPDIWRKRIILLCAALLLLDAGIAWYHAGVEIGVFPGPAACSNTSGGSESLEEMRKSILNAPLVPCSQAMAHFLGLSMAAWNGIAATLLAAAALFLWRRRGR